MAPRPRPRDDHDAGLYPECRDCGSTGGFWCGGNRANKCYRKRGLCGQCYDWHRARNTHGHFPLVTTHGSHVPPQHPAIPTGNVPLRAHCGVRPDRHAIIPRGWDWVAVVTEAELFAAAWLAARTLAAA